MFSPEQATGDRGDFCYMADTESPGYLICFQYLGHIGLPSDLGGSEAEVSHVGTVLKAWGSWLFSVLYPFTVRGICKPGSPPCAGHC